MRLTKLFLLILFLILLSIPVLSATTRYIGNIAEITNGNISYKVNDRLSSQRIIIDKDGVIINEFKSLPYGQEIVNSGSKYGFTGKELDNTGLYYFSARYYDSTTGKFASVDPVASNHPYSYASNNPVNYIDPTGMDEILYLHADYSSADSDGAFKSDYLTIDGFKANDHNVHEYIINDFDKLVDSLEVAYLEYKETKIKYDLLIFAGHGAPSSMYMGAKNVYDSKGKLKNIKNSFLTDSQISKIDNKYSEMFTGSTQGILNTCSGSCSISDESLSIGQALANKFNIPMQAIDRPGSMTIDLKTFQVHAAAANSKDIRTSGYDKNGMAMYDLNNIVYSGWRKNGNFLAFRKLNYKNNGDLINYEDSTTGFTIPNFDKSNLYHIKHTFDTPNIVKIQPN